MPLNPALGGSLANYSVAYEETKLNRVSDFVLFVFKGNLFLLFKSVTQIYGKRNIVKAYFLMIKVLLDMTDIEESCFFFLFFFVSFL